MKFFFTVHSLNVYFLETLFAMKNEMKIEIINQISVLSGKKLTYKMMQQKNIPFY